MIIEFIKNNYFMPIYVAALILSIYKYRFYYNTILKYLPVLIGYTILTEIMGLLIRDVDQFQIVYIQEYSYFNSLVFNIYDLFFFGYFYFIFWKTLVNKRHKAITKYGIWVYAIASITNALFENFIIWPQLYASIVGSFVLIICIMYYFKEHHQKNKRTSDLLVWISIGLLVFNLFFPPIFFLGLSNHELYQAWNLRQVHYVLIIVMYTCIIIGFARLKRRITPDEI